MKKLDNIEQLEDLFRDNLDKVQVTPPADVWSSVSSSVAGNSTSVISQLSSYFSSVTNIIKVALFTGGVATLGLVLYNANNNVDIEIPESSKTEQINEVTEPNMAVTDNITNDSELEDGVEEKSESTRPNNNATQSNANGNSSNQGISGTNSNSTQNNAGENTPEASQEAPAGSEKQLITPNDPKPVRKATVNLCVNTIKPFNNNVAGDWYVNDKKVANNQKNYSFSSDAIGRYTVKYNGPDYIQLYIVETQELNGKIIHQHADDGQSVFTIEGAAISNYKWTIDGETVSNAPSYSKNFTQGKHIIQATIDNGTCQRVLQEEISLSDQGSLQLIMYDFSPNNDGFNDAFEAKCEDCSSYHIRIIDAGRNVVYESTDPNASWNGKTNNVGDECPTGKYIVIIQHTINGVYQEPLMESIELVR